MTSNTSARSAQDIAVQAIRDRIASLTADIHDLQGAEAELTGNVRAKAPGHAGATRTISAEGRKRIAAASRKRWAAYRASNGKSTTVAAPVKHRTISAAGRKRIAAAQKARWAKHKAQQAKGKAMGAGA